MLITMKRLYTLKIIFTAITDDDIVAQAFTFFLGGFDTIATALMFSTQLLAQHPDIQERLRDEVDAVFERGDGKISYEDINELKYMDMVISGKIILLSKIFMYFISSLLRLIMRY
jgi:hypothetical protein